MVTYYIDLENGNDANSGTSWANAWRTISSGPTAARTVPGDIVNISKTPDPFSIGNATWTNKSKTVTLASAKTSLVDNCEAAWTVANTSTITTSTSRKQGSNSIRVSKASALTNTLYAYKELPNSIQSIVISNGGTGYSIGDQMNILGTGTGAVAQVTSVSGGVITGIQLNTGGTGYISGVLSTSNIIGTGIGATFTATITPTNFSSYDALTFWALCPSSSAVLTNHWKIVLCSDTAGAVAVDEILIPASLTSSSNGKWYSNVISRNGGGNLGSSIKSVALYSGSVAPTSTISLDNINACNQNDLTLRTLISKNNNPMFDISEGWWAIQSIVGVTILLEATPGTTDVSGRGYAGVTETVQSYARKTFPQGPVDATTTNTNVINESYVSYVGGWDTSLNTKNGMTILDGVNGNGENFASGTTKSFINFSDLWIVRFWEGCYLDELRNCTFTNCGFSNCTNNLVTNTTERSIGNIFQNVFLHSSFNNLFSNGLDTNNVFINCKIFSHTSTSYAALSVGRGGKLIGCEFSNNYNLGEDATLGQSLSYQAINSIFETTVSKEGLYVFLKNCLFSSVVEFLAIESGENGRYYSHQHDQTSFDYIVTDGGTMNTEATDRAGQTGKMWKMVIQNSTRNSSYPLDLSVGQFAVSANNLVTVKAWMKKSHATSCNGKLRVKAYPYQLAGITSDVVATLDNNTNWQELTLTFTPTEAGVFEVEALAEYVSANANVYIDTITVTQA